MSQIWPQNNLSTRKIMINPDGDSCLFTLFLCIWGNETYNVRLRTKQPKNPENPIPIITLYGLKFRNHFRSTNDPAISYKEKIKPPIILSKFVAYLRERERERERSYTPFWRLSKLRHQVNRVSIALIWVIYRK